MNFELLLQVFISFVCGVHHEITINIHLKICESWIRNKCVASFSATTFKLPVDWNNFEYLNLFPIPRYPDTLTTLLPFFKIAVRLFTKCKTFLLFKMPQKRSKCSLFVVRPNLMIFSASSQTSMNNISFQWIT